MSLSTQGYKWELGQAPIVWTSRPDARLNYLTERIDDMTSRPELGDVCLCDRN